MSSLLFVVRTLFVVSRCGIALAERSVITRKLGGGLGTFYLVGEQSFPSYDQILPYAEKAAALGVQRVRLFDYSDVVLRALRDAYARARVPLEVILNLPNKDLDRPGMVVKAARKYQSIVRGIWVGTEPCYHHMCNTTQGILMRALQTVLAAMPEIQVSVPFADVGILKNTYPVQDSEFLHLDFMESVLQVLQSSRNPIVYNAYPYLDRLQAMDKISRDFALGNGSVRVQKELKLVSQLDADLRCLRFAMQKAGAFEDVPIVIGETGWATGGLPTEFANEASPGAAQEFIDSTVGQLLAGRWDDIGVSEIYLYELFDEPHKPPEDTAGLSARHWGISELNSPWLSPPSPPPSLSYPCDAWGLDPGSKELLMPAWLAALTILFLALGSVATFVRCVARKDSNRRSIHRSEHFDMDGQPTGPQDTANYNGSHADLSNVRDWAQAMAKHAPMFEADVILDAPKIDRTECLYRVVAFYRESADELQDTLQSVLQWPQQNIAKRLFVFVDGLQLVPGSDPAQASAACQTLCNLGHVLPLGHPFVSRGCVIFMGKAHPSGVPFEVYVKGPGVPRSKWESQVEFISILAADVRESGREPQAVMLGDGDCCVDPDSVQLMYRYLLAKSLGGVGPYFIPAKVRTPTELHAGMRYWTQAIETRGLSAMSFHYPLYGPCQLWSIRAIKAISSEYTASLRAGSLWDNAQVLNGEDGFATTCCHAVGLSVRILPNAYATTYVPSEPLDYVAQQCRWRLGECSNLDLNFCRPRAWRGFRCLTWPLRVVDSVLMEAPMGAGTLTLAGSFIGEAVWTSTTLLGGYAHGDIGGLRPGVAIHTLIWLSLMAYGAAAAGTPVKSRPRLNRAVMCIMYVTGVVFPALLVYLVVNGNAFCWLPWRLIVVNIFILRPLSVWGGQLPHKQPWGYAVWLFWYQGLAYWVDMVQAPLLAMSTVEGAAGWGTRTSGDDAARAFSKAALWKRRGLLSLWLLSNYLLGAVPLQIGCAQAFLATVFSCQLLENFEFLLCGLIYSLRCWIFARRVRGNSGSSATEITQQFL